MQSDPYPVSRSALSGGSFWCPDCTAWERGSLSGCVCFAASLSGSWFDCIIDCLLYETCPRTTDQSSMWFVLRSLGFQRFVAEGQRDIVHYIRLNLIKRDTRSLARSLVKLRSDRSHDTSTFSFSGWKLSCGAVCRIIESGEQNHSSSACQLFSVSLWGHGVQSLIWASPESSGLTLGG